MTQLEAMGCIAIVMAVSCVFGYGLRGIVDQYREDRLNGLYDDDTGEDWDDDPPKYVEDNPNRCETCAFAHTALYEMPCVDCVDFDEWMQEGEETDDLCED